MSTDRPLSAPWKGLFPDEVVVEVATADEHAGLEAERELVQKAVDLRRGEFLAVRDAARRAITRLGGPSTALLPEEGGAPRWPAGFVGSLSHSRGWCAAAVAASDRFAGVGLDLERVRTLAPRLIERLLTPAERAVLGRADEDRRDLLALLSFSAKESFYKCQWPGSRRFLGFHAAEIEWEESGFLVHPKEPIAGWPDTPVRGRWRRHEEFVLTAIALPR